MTKPVCCTYCGKPARLVEGPELYPHRRDLAQVKAWRCDPCNAQIGCHDGTETPKGTFAKPELQAARQRAHRAFDPLWQNFRQAYPAQQVGAPEPVIRRIARDRAYDWLTFQMGATRKVHIGEMNLIECNAVVEIINKHKPTPISIRAWAKQRKAA